MLLSNLYEQDRLKLCLLLSVSVQTVHTFSLICEIKTPLSELHTCVS